MAVACVVGELLVRAEERLCGWLVSTPTYIELSDRAGR
jgi:hypothetical protein